MAAVASECGKTTMPTVRPRQGTRNGESRQADASEGDAIVLAADQKYYQY